MKSLKTCWICPLEIHVTLRICPFALNKPGHFHPVRSLNRTKPSGQRVLRDFIPRDLMEKSLFQFQGMVIGICMAISVEPYLPDMDLDEHLDLRTSLSESTEKMLSISVKCCPCGIYIMCKEYNI